MRRRMTSLLLITAVALALAPTSRCRAALKRIGSEVEISGRIADIRHTTESSGYSFRARLSGIHYSGRVDRTLLERKNATELTVWLALRDVVLIIDRTTISGRPGGATCGPMQIQMGHRRDLWVAFDFQTAEEYETAGFETSGDEKQPFDRAPADAKSAQERTLAFSETPSLKLIDTRFGLPADNWSVGDPAWVRTSGFGVTRSKVIRGLRSGLTKNRERIESRLIEVAPKMLVVAARKAHGSRPVGLKDTPAERQSVEQAMHNKLLEAGYVVPAGAVATATDKAEK